MFCEFVWFGGVLFFYCVFIGRSFCSLVCLEGCRHVTLGYASFQILNLLLSVAIISYSVFASSTKLKMST